MKISEKSMKRMLSLLIVINLFLGSCCSVIGADIGIKRNEDTESIAYEDEFIVATYDKSNDAYKVSLKPSARSIRGFENWHLSDPRDHYLRLKRDYELQRGEELEPKEPGESENIISYSNEEVDPNINF